MSTPLKTVTVNNLADGYIGIAPIQNCTHSVEYFFLAPAGGSNPAGP